MSQENKPSFFQVFDEKFQMYFDELEFSYSSDQLQLREQLYQFSIDRDANNLLLLNGYAGTGKTSMLGAYVQTLKYFQVKTKLLAPTGRAAKVLSKRADTDAITIHKQIYRSQSKESDYGLINLMPNLHSNTVFIVDEASMIPEISMQSNGNVGRELLSDLIEYVFQGKNCKLIFLGDKGQLPPVGSSFSPALNSYYLSNHYPKLKLRKVELHQVLRQAENSGILLNATIIRKTIFPEKYQFQFNEKDFYQLNGADLQQELESCYDKFGVEETLVVTRSNKRANIYNQQIRNRILWYEEELCQQDYMMVVKNNYFWLSPESKAGFIANGELIKIKRIKKYEHLYGFDFVRVIIQLIDYEEEDLEVLILKECIHAESPNLSRDRMKELFFEIEKDYLYEKNKKKRYDFILKNPYFNALQVKFAYAVTCHKSQGGQWDAVFIDQGVVSEEMKDQDFYRWMYTAITRGKEKVYLLG